MSKRKEKCVRRRATCEAKAETPGDLAHCNAEYGKCMKNVETIAEKIEKRKSRRVGLKGIASATRMLSTPGESKHERDALEAGDPEMARLIGDLKGLSGGKRKGGTRKGGRRGGKRKGVTRKGGRRGGRRVGGTRKGGRRGGRRVGGTRRRR